jgi:transcriptional regulator of acetoin/glycerol metabolism
MQRRGESDERDMGLLSAAAVEAWLAHREVLVRYEHAPPPVDRWPGGTMQDIKRREALRAVDFFRGNVRRAAEALAISPTTLYRLLPDGWRDQE